MTRRPIAVVVGFIAKLPVAGMAMYNFHYIAGLRQLGYDVHYVERLNEPDECYDPTRNTSGDDPGYGLQWLGTFMQQHAWANVPWTLIDRQGHFRGVGRDELCQVIRNADFVLTLADPTWFDELELCPRRAFVDGDPVFTQAEMLEPDSLKSNALARYPTLFTYWSRQQSVDTRVPPASREWLSTTPVVATELWTAAPPKFDAPVTTVMNWSSGNDVDINGVIYGHKNREFERFIGLPERTGDRFLIAVGGPAPKDRLRASGWRLADPIQATGTLEAYRDFIHESLADLGVAKHAYVASRSGWFSDRSLCYLASGRPVLHQDTGFTDWLPVGEGVLSFSDIDDVLAGLENVDQDPGLHGRAAREIAEEYFEARKVIGRMLDDAGWR
jgi:hypothetical protein